MFLVGMPARRTTSSKPRIIAQRLRQSPLRGLYELHMIRGFDRVKGIFCPAVLGPLRELSGSSPSPSAVRPRPSPILDSPSLILHII